MKYSFATLLVAVQLSSWASAEIIEAFDGNSNCVELGYDYGYKMEGCFPNTGIKFDSLSLEGKPSCSATDVGSFDLQCSEADDDQWKYATIDPTVEVGVIMKSSTGGLLHKLEPGESTKIASQASGKIKAISHIEFCFKCPATPAPVTPAPVTPAPVTPAPVTPAPVTPAPVTPAPVPVTPAPVTPVEPAPAPAPAPGPSPASSSGDPHFKTWSGEKFDYHGACDLVLVDNPSFENGLGLKVHIRTTSVKYFSYIEQIVVKIGDESLEFNNDVTNFLLNGKPAEPVYKWHETKLSGFVVRRDPKAISIRLNKADPQHPGAKIDLIQRNLGFPAVIFDSADTDIFKGSLGLLGDFATGKKIARDGETELEDPTTFALEWQVRDTEPMLFSSARYPQFPTQCTPPKKMMGNRLGISHMQAEAEKACASWKEDKEDCIFDVIATRDVLAAEGGSVVG